METIKILGKDIAIKYMDKKEMSEYAKTLDNELDDDLIYYGICFHMSEEILIHSKLKDKKSTIYHEAIHMLIYLHNCQMVNEYTEEQLVSLIESNRHEINKIYTQIYGG